MNQNFTVRKLARCAVVAALYVVLCMALQLWGHFSQLLLDLDMAEGSYILLGWNYNQGMVSFVASMLLLNAATLIFAFRGEFRETYLRQPEVPAETAPRMTPEERLEAARQAAYLWNIGKVIHNGMCD